MMNNNKWKKINKEQMLMHLLKQLWIIMFKYNKTIYQQNLNYKVSKITKWKVLCQETLRIFKIYKTYKIDYYYLFISN